MDLFNGLLAGFQVAVTPANLFFCFVGVFVGTLVGVLPGIGPVGAISILFPLTFALPTAPAIIMLAGIYYGAQYGGSTTAILLNIPGEPGSIVTCIDGYQMGQKGRAGAALGISAIGSFVGGTFSVLGLVLLTAPLAEAALKFGPPQYFSIVCLSMFLIVYVARGSFAKATMMIFVGLILRTTGADTITGIPRFTFGAASLFDGIGIVPLAMGIFGVSEVLVTIEGAMERSVAKTKLTNIYPTMRDLKNTIGSMIRGSFIGFFIGLFPGGGASISSFTSYIVEKKISKHPDDFGTGVIEAVAGPETANNASAGGAFVPLFALGIPAHGSMAIIMGALMIHGVIPGPTFISEYPEVFWGTIASMYIGNVMLLLLNLPLIGLWVSVLKIPARLLMPLIILLCLVGGYSADNRIVDVIMLTIFGIAGYVLKKFSYEPAPLLLAFILEPLLEMNFRQSLIMSHGGFSIFFQGSICVVAWVIMAILLIFAGFSQYSKTKDKIVTE